MPSAGERMRIALTCWGGGGWLVGVGERVEGSRTDMRERLGAISVGGGGGEEAVVAVRGSWGYGDG